MPVLRADRIDTPCQRHQHTGAAQVLREHFCAAQAARRLCRTSSSTHRCACHCSMPTGYTMSTAPAYRCCTSVQEYSCTAQAAACQCSGCTSSSMPVLRADRIYHVHRTSIPVLHKCSGAFLCCTSSSMPVLHKQQLAGAAQAAACQCSVPTGYTHAGAAQVLRSIPALHKQQLAGAAQAAAHASALCRRTGYTMSTAPAY